LRYLDLPYLEALAYNVGQAAFGGTIPFIATAMVVKNEFLLTPSFYVSGLALMGALAVLGLAKVGGMRRALQDTMLC